MATQGIRSFFLFFLLFFLPVAPAGEYGLVYTPALSVCEIQRGLNFLFFLLFSAFGPRLCRQSECYSRDVS